MMIEITHCSAYPSMTVGAPPRWDCFPSSPLATAFRMTTGLDQLMSEAAPISIVPATTPPTSAATVAVPMPLATDTGAVRGETVRRAGAIMTSSLERGSASVEHHQEYLKIRGDCEPSAARRSILDAAGSALHDGCRAHPIERRWREPSQ